MNEKLLAFRDEIQGMCFYWKSTHRHGHCKEANGMDHVCCFCELTEKFDAILSDFRSARLDELFQLAEDYRRRGYREPEMLTDRIHKLELPPMNTKTSTR